MIYYLLIEWAGARWLWLSEGRPPSGVQASFAGAWNFPGWSLEASLEPTTTGISVELAWDGVARLVNMGHSLDTAKAEIGWLEEGDTWEQRSPLMLGTVKAEYGGDGELVSAQIDPRPWEDTGLLLEPGQSVSKATWASPPAATDGRGYPLPIGRPGVYQDVDGSTLYCSATPCIPVATDTLLVAAARVASTTLTVYSELDDDQESFSITYGLDSDGQTVAKVDLSAAATIIYDAAGTYWARWPSGGIATSTGEPLESAGEIISWALRHSGLDVDAGALEAIRAPLDAYLLGGFVDQSVSPWAWLTQEILPLLPVRLLQGPRGIRPVLWRPPSAALAVDLLDVDRGEVARDGRITSAGTPINDLTIRYAWRARTGDYLRSRRLAGRGGHISTAAAVASYRALKSRPGETIETEWVYRDDTADRILLSQIEMRQPRRTMALVGSLDRLRQLRPLDVVTVSDSSVSLSSVPALVSRIEWSGPVARILLELST